MHEPETAADNRSRAKLVLAIGLTVVFILVVALQVWNHGADARATEREKANGSATDQLDADHLQLTRFDRTLATDGQPGGIWPKVRLSECTPYDPFATPDGFIVKKERPFQRKPNDEALRHENEIAKKRAAQEQVISSLREAGVNAVFQGSEQNTAIVGTRMVRIGEEVEGFRVLAIETDGIVIERPAVE